MTKRMRQLGRWLLIGTLLVSMGGHLALLQTIAWTQMLVDFSTTDSISTAVGKTFDGEHPCPLCKAVKKTKSEEEKKPLVKSELKKEIAVPAPVDVPSPRFTELEFRVTEYSGNFADIYLAVPLQPPRAV